MRHRAALALLFAALPMTANAQRLTQSGVARPHPAEAAPKPPTRFIARVNTYMNWGTAIGAASGAAVAYATSSHSDLRAGDVVVAMMVGAAVGNLAGLVAGLHERQPSDSLAAPVSQAVLNSPMPVLAARIDNTSQYVGFGGRIGMSVGFLGAMVLADNGRIVAVPLGALGGYTVGMLAGAIAYSGRSRQ